METVSEKMIAYALNKSMNCGDICNSIGKLVNDFQKNNPNSEAVLVLDIKPIISSHDNSGPLRLENKEIDN